MKALVYTAPNRVEVHDLPEPRPAAGEVRVRVDAAGICGSDLHAYKGHDPRRVPPLVLGHEFVGTILEGPRAGSRVTANPLATCGRCAYCREGRSNLCTDRRMIGMNIPGAFAEQLAVPEQCLIDVPPGASDRVAALTEPAATVVHALNLGARASLRPLPACRTLVIGAGAIGLLAVLALKSDGAATTVVETSPLRRGSLKSAAGLDAVDASAIADMQFDLVFDAVGAAATRDLSIRVVAPGGVVVHVGLADWDSRLDWRTLTLREITLVGCYTYTHDDLRTAVELLAQGRFGALDWVEERPLAEGAEAFDALAAGRVSSPKVLLRPRGR